MLRIKQLSVKANEKKIIKSFSFIFKKGKIYFLMGPNGSGKSTIAQTIMGSPHYTITKKSKILFVNKNITNLFPDKRAILGLYLSFQHSPVIEGVSVFQLLRLVLEKKVDALTLHKNIAIHAKKLGIQEELLNRSLNDGFSGGEKKKIEALQYGLIDPKCAIFDEIDTGVDVDAMKKIIFYLKNHFDKNKTYIFITHYNKIMRYIKPDEVIVIKKGKIAKTGGKKLALFIEKHGYESL